MATFRDKLNARIAAANSRLCVGIDPRIEKHGGLSGMRDFVLEVVAETAEYAAAFKPNIAYFEAQGSAGYAVLEELLAAIPAEVPVVLDCKRGDIGTTAEQYAKAYFETLPNVDAVTLNGYMGFDTVEPFLQYPGKGVYLLGVTSNPGATDVETLPLADGRSVFEAIADMAAKRPDDIGLVVGLTNAAANVLDRIPDVPLLIPGLGAQGGDLAALSGQDRSAPPLINVSRGITYADESFANRAEHYRDVINAALV